MNVQHNGMTRGNDYIILLIRWSLDQSLGIVQVGVMKVMYVLTKVRSGIHEAAIHEESDAKRRRCIPIFSHNSAIITTSFINSSSPIKPNKPCSLNLNGSLASFGTLTFSRTFIPCSRISPTDLDGRCRCDEGGAASCWCEVRRVSA